jgi:hypothetical protein
MLAEPFSLDFCAYDQAWLKLANNLLNVVNKVELLTKYWPFQFDKQVAGAWEWQPGTTAFRGQAYFLRISHQFFLSRIFPEWLENVFFFSPENT